jgi:ribA/ribD-fused uncharacterized protein
MAHSQPHKLDTNETVFFYEQEFYVLSNFSSFRVNWKGFSFDTAEHAYHWEKFNNFGSSNSEAIKQLIRIAPSAHQAFKIAQTFIDDVPKDWDKIKCKIMKNILLAKVNQHEYVKRKLLETGDRHLVEDSWRDSVWGWGPDRNGQNLLGKLWMEIREEIKEESN